MIRAGWRAPGAWLSPFNVGTACALAIVGALYAKGFGGFWLGDDLANITHLYDLSQEGRLVTGTLSYFAAGLAPTGSLYRPLSMISLAANFAAAGTSYPGWYVLSFTVHLANVALLSLLVERVAALCNADASWSAPLAAALFGLAPALAEGVYWQSARADEWVTLLSLLAVHAWIGSGRGAWWLFPALVAALMFKESAALLPLQIALLAWALPGKRSHAQRMSLVLAFAVLVAFFAWRIYLFGHVWQVYVAPSAETARPDWSVLIGSVVSVAPWWKALTAIAPTAAVVYAFVLGAMLVLAALAAADSRARAWVALALAGASGGMILATLLNLGGLSAGGEGGRLAYGPSAWLALSIGVACSRPHAASHATSSAVIRAASLCATLVACAVGAWILFAVLRQAFFAQDGVRALTRSLPSWAAAHDGLTLLIVPEWDGPVVVARNAQAGFVLPPLQDTPLLHRVLPTLPGEIGTRYEQLQAGLAERLTEQPPQRISADVLLELSRPAATRWPDHYACWSQKLRKIADVATPPTESKATWSGDLMEAAKTQCGIAS